MQAKIVSERKHYSLIELSSVDSTNNYAANVLSDGSVADFTVILAHNQTAGRGQRGSVWQTAPNKNLTASVIVTAIHLPASQHFLLNMAVSLSVHKLLRHVIKKDIFVKWPNDIWVEDSKIAGLLIENTIHGNTINESIIGLGLNLNQTDFPEGINATSLKQITGADFDVIEVLDLWIAILKKQLQDFKAEPLKKEYLSYLKWLHIEQTYHYKNHELKATIIDVDASGRLVLVSVGGQRMVADLKEIKHV